MPEILLFEIFLGDYRHFNLITGIGDKLPAIT